MQTSRRAFLRLSAAAMAGSLLAACTGKRGVVPPPEVPTVAPTAAEGAAPVVLAQRYREAPMLAEQVARGELPPVEERLPIQPMVLGAASDVGRYGGILRRLIQETGYASSDVQDRGRSFRSRSTDTSQSVNSLDAQRLLFYDENAVRRPWLCESWEYDEEGVWALHLRRGLRWSDGVPFTFQDVVFSIEHGPSVGSDRARQTLRDRFEVVDDHLLRVHNASLNGLDNLMDSVSAFQLILPAHYVRQFLPEFGEADALRARARTEMGGSVSGQTPADSVWTLWWEQQTDWRRNPNLPTLNPWVLAISPEAETFTYRRNPYCWLVDVAGNQLPYLDEVSFTWTDAARLRETLGAGGADVADQGLGLRDYSWLQAHIDRSNYDVLLCPSPGQLALQMNLSVPDLAKRAFVNDRRVRQASSLLLRRENLNLSQYEGLLTARQLAPVTGGDYANEDLAGSFLSHDAEEANRLLDEAGYAERDVEGYRLYAEGGRVSWVIVEISATRSVSSDVEMLIECLADGGIEASARAMPEMEFLSIWSENGWDALYGRLDLPVVPTLRQFGFWAGQGGRMDRWYGLFSPAPFPYAVTPPPGHFLYPLWALYDEYAATTSEEERIRLWQRAMEIWREELPAIGLLGRMPRLVVARKKLRGLDPAALYADELGGLGGGQLALFHYAAD